MRYLKNVRQVKDSTANHYIDALNHITRYLVNKDMVEKSIYEISEIGELEVLRTFLKNDKDFIELDKRGHQMYSAGMNNYYKFASGEGFRKIHGTIELLDVEMPAKDFTTTEIKQ